MTVSSRARFNLLQRTDHFLRCVLLGLSLLTSGCYHYRVTAPQVAALDDGRSETKWSFLWGLVQQSETDTSCLCMNNGLKEVAASTNIGYMLIGVITLGIVVPVKLEYVCGKPPGLWPLPPDNCPDQVLLEAPAGRLPADHAPVSLR